MPSPEDQPTPKPSTVLPGYSLEEEAPTGLQKWLRGRRLILLCCAVTAGTVALFAAKPLYREAKARRAIAVAHQAGQAIDRGEAAEASRLLRQAALMAFQDERVAGLVTLHAARAGDMASVAALGKKFSAGQASAREILVYAEASLRAGRISDAALAAEALPPDLPPDLTARGLVARSGVLHAQGKTDEAAAALRAALSPAPGPLYDGVRVALATLLLSGPAAEEKAEAEQLLETAAANPGEDGAAALRLLCASRAGLTPEAQRKLDDTAERLRSHPAGRSGDEILLARLAMNADATRAKDVVAALVKNLREGKTSSLETRVAAARWLVGQSHLGEVLELITDEEAGSHAGALMVRLDALSGLGEWEGTSALLEKNRGGTLPDTLYHLFRARMAAEEGDTAATEEEKRQLRTLMSFAELPHVLFVARYAETVGWKPEALAAWRVLASDERARPDAIRGQLRNLPPNAPAAEGLALTRELLDLQPDDPSVRLSAAYFRLLAGTDSVNAASIAEDCLAANPDSTDLRRVAALARLRTGKASEGLAIWPGDGDENRWRALHVALLRESGQSKAATAAAAEIDTDALGPEEKEWLAGSGADESVGTRR